MLKHFKKVVSKCDVNLEDRNKNEDFYKSLNELVTILFAVVFGVGLSQIKEVEGTYDLFVLLLAYIAALLSWWGYHRGIIIGPKETNVLTYSIDIILMVVYWWLINVRSPLPNVLIVYTIMFYLYLLWEVIRYFKENITSQQKIITSKAIKTNYIFTCIILIYFINSNWLYFKPEMSEWYYIFVLLGTLIAHRRQIHFDYKLKEQNNTSNKIQKNLEETLIEEAKAIAFNAKAHLSGLRIGAAILSETGKIYVGCNIEFDNYSNTIHAEEAALSALIAAGEKLPVSIAIFTSDNEIHFPCGMCLQSLLELGGKDLIIIACNKIAYQKKTMKELLPFGFQL